MARIGHKISLSESDKQELLVMSHSNKLEHRYVQRAKIILLSSEGKSYNEIQQQLQITSVVVSKWKNRFIKDGISGLVDKPRSGKPSKYTEKDKNRVMQLANRKHNDGGAKWTQRQIATESGMSQGKVQTILSSDTQRSLKKNYWRGKSTDPEFETQMIDVVGLYMSKTVNAIILSVDDRTPPELSIKTGQVGRSTNTYKSHRTVSLLAALSVHKGEVTANAVGKHTHGSFLNFLTYLYRKYPQKQLHIILDMNASKHNKLSDWAESKKRITMHYTPNSSWLNQIEIWFWIMTRDVMSNGVWHSKKQLVNQLMEFIKTCNKDITKPFHWTYAE